MSRFAEDVAGAHYSVLNVRAGLALKAQRIFEVEGDDRIARELEHEVAQRADGDLFGNVLPFGLVAAGLARVDLGARGGDELVDQVVGLDAEALAPADFDVRTGQIFWRNVVAQLDRAARRERDHLVAEVRVVVGLLGVAHAAQRLNHVGLRIALARVDHVIDGLRAAKVRMRLHAVHGRDPALVIRIGEEWLVAEVAAEQAKLPEVIGDVFADIRHGAVGTHDDFGIFIGALRPSSS